MIVLKHAYMLSDEGVQLFDLKEVTADGKWIGVLIPIEVSNLQEDSLSSS